MLFGSVDMNVKVASGPSAPVAAVFDDEHPVAKSAKEATPATKAIFLDCFILFLPDLRPSRHERQGSGNRHFYLFYEIK
ncbi:hypothetical protein ACNPON_03650 [Glutamicibacter sp. AGC13]